MNQPCVFLSFEHNNPKSEPTMSELRKFFSEWGCRVEVARNEPRVDPVEKAVCKMIGQCDYFLQILTDTTQSEWMKKEWLAAETCSAFHQRPRRVYLAYTEDAKRNRASAKLIHELEQHELPHVVPFQIDNEESARPILEGLLVELERLDPVAHGKIELPACNCASDEAETKDYRGMVRALEGFVDSFQKAMQLGLEQIEVDRDQAQSRLRSRFENAQDEKIKMLGFTLRRYVDPEHDSGLGGKLQQAMDSRRVKLDLLLLDPHCDAARQRIAIESPKARHEESLLVKDSTLVTTYLSARSDKVTWKYYRHPYVGLVIFSDLLFVECYHLSKNVGADGICGQVPIMVARRGSFFYRLFESHFQSVWDAPEASDFSARQTGSV